MTAIPKFTFLALALLALPSCAELGGDGVNLALSAPTIQQTVAIPQPQKKSAPVIQPNFSCTSGLKFNASFSHDRRFACIVFSDSAVRHKLRNINVASGFEYSNGKIVYREYKEKTTLTHLDRIKARTDVCRSIPAAHNKTQRPQQHIGSSNR